MEDCVTWAPLRNRSVALSPAGPLPQENAPYLVTLAQGFDFGRYCHTGLKLRDFSVRLPGLKAQLCCLPSGVMWGKVPNLSGLSRDGDRAYFAAYCEN